VGLCKPVAGGRVTATYSPAKKMVCTLRAKSPPGICF
jgi:hypothetical protein